MKLHFTLTINSPEDAWDFIRFMYSHYHKDLKKFGYDYEQFIPDLKSVDDFFKDETYFKKMQQKTFNENDIEFIKDDFMNYYSLEHFTKAVNSFKELAIPKINEILPKLQIMQKNWGMFIPENLNVWFTYGNGGSYCADKNNPGIILRGSRFNLKNMEFVSTHEFVHICIEEDIIQKYKIPQDIKEQIVDVICVDYLGTQKHKQHFTTPNFSEFINTKSVVENLPEAVRKLNKHLATLKT